MTYPRLLPLLIVFLGGLQAFAGDALPVPPAAISEEGVTTYSRLGSGDTVLAPSPPESSPALSPRPMESNWTPPGPTVVAPPERLVEPVESSWYTRVDWFHWTEKILDLNFVTESGALYTLGYERKVGCQRFRAELFGGDVSYDGYGVYDNGDLEPLGSTTRYLGARGEIEYLCGRDVWEDRGNFILGLGSRFWVRDLMGGIGDYGSAIGGYQETWWTLYPYLGMESRHRLGSSLILYSQARIGVTAFSYSHAELSDEPVWPRCGLTSLLEVGLRGEHFFLSGECEVMTWSESAVNAGYYQPDSQMVTVGGRLGFHY